MDIWVISTFWLLWIMLLWIFAISFVCLCVYLFSTLLGIYLGVEFLGHMVALWLTSEELSNYFPKWLHHFTFPPVMHKGSNFSISSPTHIICLFDYNHPSGCEVVSHCDFYLHFPDVEHLFMPLFPICILSLEKFLFRSFVHLEIGLSFYCWVVRVLYLSWVLDLYHIQDLQIFSLLYSFYIFILDQPGLANLL